MYIYMCVCIEKRFRAYVKIYIYVCIRVIYSKGYYGGIS